MRTLVVTTFGRPGYLRRALEAGASGFVVKDTPARQLAEAVRRVHAGLRVVDPSLATESLVDGANPLTDREREVLGVGAARRHGRRHRRRRPPVAGHGAQPPQLGHRQDRHLTRAEAARVAQDRGWL